MIKLIIALLAYIVILLITLAFCKISHKADEDIKSIIKDIKAFKDYDRHNVHIDFVINNNSDDNVSCLPEKIYQHIISCEKEVV